MKVAIVMGSSSDLETMRETQKILEEFKIPFDTMIMSAHRTPSDVATFAEYAYRDGYRLIIAGAGMSAHLAGVIAANTTVPVIGVPMGGGHLNGVDALYSTVNMPGGIPVMTMGIGKAGAKNAGLAAVHMFGVIGLKTDLLVELVNYRKRQGDFVRSCNADIQK